MRNFLRWKLSLCSVLILAPSALGLDYFLEPREASGPHTINGNQIILDGADQTVVLEIRIDNWDPVTDVGVCLNGSLCSVSQQDCPSGQCQQSNGLLQTYQVVVDGSSYEGVLDPVALPLDDMIEPGNPEWIFAGSTALRTANTTTDDFLLGALVLTSGDAVAYAGEDKYCATLTIDVPAGAVGSYTINLIANPNQTFARDTMATPIVPVNLAPAIISIACQTNADCNDSNACTTDTCLPDDTCQNAPNFDEATFCCNPADGMLTMISDGLECTEDICNPDDGSVTHPPLPAGSSCGSPVNTECDNPDTCDGAGTCQTNLEPSGTACGDPTDTECNGADTCNGSGMCQMNIAPSGTACGDPSDTDCTNPDTCNGVGVCNPNNAANGVTCDDGLFCNEGETCMGGVCTGGDPTDCDDGLPCTADSCNEDTDVCDNVLQPGNCLIDGVCYMDGEFNPANDCEVCDPATSTSDWTLRPAGSECDDGNPCTGTGAPGIGVDTCDDMGVCMGMLDPSCNDGCEDAVEVTEGANSGTNTTAGPVDDAEASCEPNSNNDVWFVYTAPCDGEVLIRTNGSVFAPSNDTVLNVFDECGGTELACDDDSGVGLLSALTLTIVQGEDYFIRVAGFEDNVGEIVLNIDAVDDCIIDGECFAEGAINPENDCEACLPDVSSSDWSPRLRGTVCGDPADTDCDSPDACDGAGTCEVNFKPDGIACTDDGNDCTDDVCSSGTCAHPPLMADTPCGDPTDTECDNPDSCDGLGVCLDNFEDMGAACGDQSSDQCDNPDICDGSGGCVVNFVPNGTECDDGDNCTGEDICTDGSCAGTAIAEAPLVVAASSRRIDVTPLPAGSPGPVALEVTSPDWTCLLKYVDTDGSLSDMPVEQLIDDWGTIMVTDVDIVPDSTYEVRAVCGAFTSDAGSDTTFTWGDIDGDGFTNLGDAFIIVEVIEGTSPNFTVADADIWPCEPDGFVNLVEALQIVLTIEGQTYAETGCPLPCP